MITRIREEGDGFAVTVVAVEPPISDTRTVPTLAEAFAAQKSVADTGKWPDGKVPE